jgi:hypothetical protein
MNARLFLTRKTSIITLALLVAAGLFALVAKGKAGFVAPVHAQARGENGFEFTRDKFYNAFDLRGRYANLSVENDLDAKGAPNFAACVGLMTFDGFGHFTDSETHSFGGQIVREENHGTYEVNQDGTGVLHVTAVGPDGNPFSFDEPFVISDGGRQVTYIVSIDGVVSYGTLKKQ